MALKVLINREDTASKPLCFDDQSLLLRARMDMVSGPGGIRKGSFHAVRSANIHGCDAASLVKLFFSGITIILALSSALPKGTNDRLIESSLINDD